MLISMGGKKFPFRTIAIVLVVLMIFGLVDTLLMTKYVLAKNGWDVLVFVGQALVGGAIFEAGKWSLTSGAIAALTPAAATAVLAGLGALGLIIYAVHMNSSGSAIKHYEDSYGCISRDGGRTWLCPYGEEVVL